MLNYQRVPIIWWQWPENGASRLTMKSFRNFWLLTEAELIQRSSESGVFETKNIDSWTMYVYIYIYIHINTYIGICIYIYTHTRIRIYIDMYSHNHVYVFVHIHVYIMCVYVYVYVYYPCVCICILSMRMYMYMCDICVCIHRYKDMYDSWSEHKLSVAMAGWWCWCTHSAPRSQLPAPHSQRECPSWVQQQPVEGAGKQVLGSTSSLRFSSVSLNQW